MAASLILAMMDNDRKKRELAKAEAEAQQLGQYSYWRPGYLTTSSVSFGSEYPQVTLYGANGDKVYAQWPPSRFQRADKPSAAPPAAPLVASLVCRARYPLGTLKAIWLVLRRRGGMVMPDEMACSRVDGHDGHHACGIGKWLSD